MVKRDDILISNESEFSYEMCHRHLRAYNMFYFFNQKETETLPDMFGVRIYHSNKVAWFKLCGIKPKDEQEPAKIFAYLYERLDEPKK